MSHRWLHHPSRCNLLAQYSWHQTYYLHTVVSSKAREAAARVRVFPSLHAHTVVRTWGCVAGWDACLACSSSESRQTGAVSRANTRCVAVWKVVGDRALHFEAQLHEPKAKCSIKHPCTRLLAYWKLWFNVNGERIYKDVVLRPLCKFVVIHLSVELCSLYSDGGREGGGNFISDQLAKQ